MEQIIGYIAALIIGLVMGLLGGGGSILAVPVLAYLFHYDEKTATGYSLFIVGLSALVGGIRNSQNNTVVWPIALVFGVPSILGVWIVRNYVVPALPDVIFMVDTFEFTRRMAMFGLFAVMMLLSAYSMLFTEPKPATTEKAKLNLTFIFFEGLLVGALTGFVGAGGGFIIVPALIILAHLDVKKAIGTSLIIIAMKSLIGFFLGDAMSQIIDWSFLMRFTGLSLLGIFLGVYLSNFIDGNKLKKAFGYFVVVMSIFIIVMEFFIKV